jgi:predicted nuclease of predicted toxin-antitoxin system
MRCKLDENLGDLGSDLLTASGHDVSTVAQQGMGGSSDLELYETCKREDRVLITLDRDFGEVLRFPPEDMRGIVVLDCRGRLSPAAILARLRELVTFAAARSIDHELWIVEPGRVRVHERRQSL